jgi:hypothetical protein
MTKTCTVTDDKLAVEPTSAPCPGVRTPDAVAAVEVTATVPLGTAATGAASVVGDVPAPPLGYDTLILPDVLKQQFLTGLDVELIDRRRHAEIGRSDRLATSRVRIVE